MKRFLKFSLVILLSVAMASETNSCAVSQGMPQRNQQACKDISTSQTSQTAMEINHWTLTSKFNF